MLCFSSMPGVELLHLLSQFAHPPVSLNCTVTLNCRSESLTPLGRENVAHPVSSKRTTTPLATEVGVCLVGRESGIPPPCLKLVAAKGDEAMRGAFVSPRLTSQYTKGLSWCPAQTLLLSQKIHTWILPNQVKIAQPVISGLYVLLWRWFQQNTVTLHEQCIYKSDFLNSSRTRYFPLPGWVLGWIHYLLISVWKA